MIKYSEKYVEKNSPSEYFSELKYSLGEFLGDNMVKYKVEFTGICLRSRIMEENEFDIIW